MSERIVFVGEQDFSDIPKIFSSLSLVVALSENEGFGLTILEDFVTSTDDTSLLDNASGSSNENATGAHRFRISLVLTKKSLATSSDQGFIELLRLTNGIVNTMPEKTTYWDKKDLQHTFARRTYDESGNYAVEPFDIDIRESLQTETNNGIYESGAQTSAGQLTDEGLLAVGMGAGVAYVKGWECRKLVTHYVDLFKARDYLTNQGYSWAGNLAGDTINLVGEIMSAPIELGFRARDEVQGFLGANPRLNKIRQAIGEGIGIYDAQRGQGGKPKSKGERYERERIKHKEMGIGSPAAMRRLADARRIQTQQSKGYGGVYDPKVAQLLQYAMHELSPSISEKIQSRKTFGLFDTGSQRIGRGKGIG